MTPRSGLVQILLFPSLLQLLPLCTAARLHFRCLCPLPPVEELCITVAQRKRAESLITFGSGEGLDPLNIQDPGLTRLEAEKARERGRPSQVS